MIKPLKCIRVLFAVVPGIMAAQTPPAADALETLLRDSPFMPAAGARTTTAGETGPLELRSVVLEDGVFAFSIYDEASRQSSWVKLGENGYPFVARSFDHERDALTVEHRGRTMVLTLQPARMSSQQVAGATPPPLPTAGQANGPGNVPSPMQNPGTFPPGGPVPTAGPAQPGSPTVTNAQEAQRLQNMADEIRRRRRLSIPPQLPRRN
jgi:hypothetical protein